jgi:hypothetical protein
MGTQNLGITIMLVDTKWKMGFASVVHWPKVNYKNNKDLNEYPMDDFSKVTFDL